MADFFRRAARCPGRHSVPGRVREPPTNGVAVEVAARPGVNYMRGIPAAPMEEERVTFARAQGIETLAQVEVAILEPGGTFSFLKNEGQEDQEGPPAKQE